MPTPTPTPTNVYYSDKNFVKLIETILRGKFINNYSEIFVDFFWLYFC